MPTIYAANESVVLVDGQAVEGVRSLEYRSHAVRTDVYAIGGSERIGVVTGPQSVEGRIAVASASPVLDAVAVDAFFQIAAQMRQGETEVTVSFDECLLVEKSFALTAGAHGEALYVFTATRIREER